jgi:peptide/nickel transport system permease protein
VEHTTASVFIETPPRVNETRRIARVFLARRLAAFGMVVILLFIVTAIFAPLLAPHDPYQQNLAISLEQPSKEYLLGTDQVGRDILSRLIYGSRSALMIGFISICIAAFIGMTLGLIAGYFGGWSYMIIMRIIDSFMSFPMLLLALVLAALLGGGLKSVMIAIGISLMSAYARLMCAQVLKVKENDYITAAKSIGASHLRIMLYHILRNCFPPLIVLITMNMGFAILIGAGLSFLGLGIEQPGADWGNMVSVGYTFLMMRPIYAIAPGIAIMLVVFSFNMVGDGLRDALDPRLRGII